MANPLVAIVGRPNVGKSTLFNKIAGRKISITENRPGVTRDRLYADAVWRGKKFTVVDTGGIELRSADVLWREILRQADAAIDMAQVILWMVDGKEELTAADRDVAEKLRRCKKPVLLVVNKVDNFSPDKLFDYYALGLGEPFAISAEHSQGIGDVLDEVVSHFEGGDEEEHDRLKIAVVGKPNAGKSSLVNRLLGFERTIVTDIAGTTRDAIDTPFELDGQKYTQRAARLRRGAPRRRLPAGRGQFGRPDRAGREDHRLRPRAGQAVRHRHEQVGSHREGHQHRQQV